MTSLKSLQWQSLGFHFLIFSLNAAIDSIAFISGGISAQALCRKYDANSNPL